MSDFKYGDKAVHDLHGEGTVLNVFPNVNLVQFFPDRSRPGGRPVSVHPVSLTKLYRAADMHQDSFFIQDDNGYCYWMEATDLTDAVEEFIEQAPNYFAPSLMYKHGFDGAIERMASLNEFGSGLTYHVRERWAKEWLAFLSKLG